MITDKKFIKFLKDLGFEIFMGVIQSVVVDLGKTVKVIVHLSESQIIILRLLGLECENY